MVRKHISKGFIALAALGAFQAPALAGGFSRGEADTDIFFDPGRFVARGGVTYVNPRRDFDTIAGANGTDGVISDDYAIPSFAAKFELTDNLACAATYTQPFGGSSTYGTQAQAADSAADDPAGPLPGNAASKKKFTTNEYGLACDVKIQAGPGNIHFIGGGFLQSFVYKQNTLYGDLTLKDDSAPGYRLGVAYEIEEYALRAQLMYRSEVKHEADGHFTPGILAGVIGAGDRSSDGEGKLPQSLELSLQSGIAPGWLVYGSVKWTDWSVLQTLDYNIDALGPQQLEFFWRDGWTVQAGVGHAFNEKVSGTINVTWDKGVGTGADIMSDTWTVAAGAGIKAGPGELRVGAAISYMTEGSQSVAKGANFDATANGDWAYALSGSYRISF